VKVTKIQQQVKRNDRYSVYIDEVYSFSLSDYQLVSSGLHVGKEFTADELDAFLQESNYGKAYERSLNYVMIRPRSEREIREYLARTFLYPKPRMYKTKSGETIIKKPHVDKQKTTRMIERVAERLREKGYINDEAFAKAWINSRQLTKKTSKRKLEQELMVKGVHSEIIASLLQNRDDLEKENLKDIIAKKSRQTKYHDQTKLMQYLVRQGFSYQDVKEGLEQDY
jgi:regulatory protein